MTRDFLSVLSDRVVLFDGAMGTRLYELGVFLNKCFDELNLSNPDLIETVHRSYVAAGADVIETNTFGANRLKLDKHGLGDQVRVINREGAALARKSAGDLFVSFEADLLPGYFWSFPLPDGRANVGFGVERGGKVPIPTMKALWADLLARPHVREVLGPDAMLEGSHRAWPIPARVDSMVQATGRTLFTGDAAAACDLMTGEGIGQALLTGVRAAECVRDAGARGDAAGAYATAVGRELVADHRMSALLVRALRHRKGARAALAVAGASDWTRANFARWLFEDYPRALLATPRRWHRA
jgi:flavin-dependent dehydrogenase